MTFLVGPSTILPDVFTITIPSYLLDSFYYSIHFHAFSIRIDPKKPKTFQKKLFDVNPNRRWIKIDGILKTSE